MAWYLELMRGVWDDSDDDSDDYVKVEMENKALDDGDEDLAVSECAKFILSELPPRCRQPLMEDEAEVFEETF